MGEFVHLFKCAGMCGCEHVWCVCVCVHRCVRMDVCMCLCVFVHVCIGVCVCLVYSEFDEETFLLSRNCKSQSYGEAL